MQQHKKTLLKHKILPFGALSDYLPFTKANIHCYLSWEIYRSASSRLKGSIRRAHGRTISGFELDPKPTRRFMIADGQALGSYSGIVDPRVRPQKSSETAIDGIEE